VPPDQWETQINDNFFGFQETSSKSILQSAQARQRWPELYESKDYHKLLEIQKNASLS
ncbi:unnamed protein product, partial [Polarella glacialis]